MVFFFFFIFHLFIFCTKIVCLLFVLSHTKRPLRSELTARSFVYSSFTLRSVIICSSISPFIHNTIGQSHSHIHISDSPFILDHPGPSNFHPFISMFHLFIFRFVIVFFAQKRKRLWNIFLFIFRSFFLLISSPSKRKQIRTV